jgi:hypothetical protein
MMARFRSRFAARVRDQNLARTSQNQMPPDGAAELVILNLGIPLGAVKSNGAAKNAFLQC